MNTSTCDTKQTQRVNVAGRSAWVLAARKVRASEKPAKVRIKVERPVLPSGGGLLDKLV